MGELRDKLAGEVATAGWALLEPHFRRDALFVVADELDLVDAAVAIADNDVATVQRWIEEQRLVRPTPEQAERWARKGHPGFRLVIVQPFVLVQPLSKR